MPPEVEEDTLSDIRVVVRQLAHDVDKLEKLRLQIEDRAKEQEAGDGPSDHVLGEGVEPHSGAI